MAMAMSKSCLQLALRRSGRCVAPPKRNFSASAHDEYETAKWEKITILGIVTSVSLAIYNLSKGHPHFPDPPVSYFFLLQLIVASQYHALSIPAYSKQGVSLGSRWSV
ncbi:cytochrome c oxidase subunit 6a, mitochondrial-like isoform X1 [Aristolochia californica]|uniref:cytochrome c oxidase subunit 6a, mitochondrial-like isoform X1 n=1 Tax=Aristolochia californica TaxID=171875 RepID=UPI0035E337BD